jgi:hypothetical protein
LKEVERSLRGVIICRRMIKVMGKKVSCGHHQTFISQTPIQPGKEHQKRRESVCLKCGYRHRFRNALNPVRGRTGSMRFIKFPSHSPRKFLIERAQELNASKGGKSSAFETFEPKK